MKKGEKYIIEIEEVHTHVDDNGKKFPLARIKGFSSLVFDQKGLDKLEKVEKDEPGKPLNCRFVVTKSFNRVFTEGEIYEVVKGRFLDDNDRPWPRFEMLINENELISYLKGACEICVIKE